MNLRGDEIWYIQTFLFDKFILGKSYIDLCLEIFDFMSRELTKHPIFQQLYSDGFSHILKVWRLITSQFVYGSFAELLYSSALFYNMRTLERHWGTRKFAVITLTPYHHIATEWVTKVFHSIMLSFAHCTEVPFSSLLLIMAQHIQLQAQQKCRQCLVFIPGR